MDLDVNNVDTCQVIVYIYLFTAGAYRNDVLFHTITCDFLQLVLTDFWLWLDRVAATECPFCKMEIWIWD